MSAQHSEMTATAKVFVVINRKAGGGKDEGFEANLGELFKEQGRDCVVLHIGGGVDLRTRLASANLPDNAVVIAGGGDGTVSAVAAELAGTRKVLGVLPMGTLNHFAKDLGIPLDLRGAVQTAAQGAVSRIDVGEVNGRIFVNNSGLGIYPQIVSQREAEQKQRGTGKWPAFTRATFSSLRRYPFLSLRIRVAGEERLLETACVFVGNNEYEVTGLKLGGRNCMNAGKLGFYVANRTGRLGLFRLAFRAVVGCLNQAKDFESFCIDEAWVETGKHSLLVSTDGEVTRMKTPLHYRIRPGALQALVPRQAEEARAA